jgi:glycosyltransferase involved in cell wall biosynthesis
MSSEMWVVVPAYNEAASIGATLAALGAQTDLDFALVVVDNSSTDGTGDVVRRMAATLPFDVVVVEESSPGAGAAADTGFRYAIGRGATMLARTDADCRPTSTWVATAKAVLGAGAEMACGRSVPRRDEHPSLIENYGPSGFSVGVSLADSACGAGLSGLRPEPRLSLGDGVAICSSGHRRRTANPRPAARGVLATLGR